MADDGHLNCTRVQTKHDGDVCHMQPGQEGQVLIALFLAVVVILFLRWTNKKWKAKEEEFEKASGVMNEASQFASSLVRHFMPSMKVAKYQFRGIRPPKATINIAFHNLGLTLHNGKKVLNGVTGEFKAGRMCAIMGPSGAGKTTFMNVLSGKATYGTMGGKVLINGYSVPIEKINSVVGFVPQDDIVHNNLTVREQIRFAAILRNKVGMSNEHIERITDDVLSVMQIDHIQKSIVGSVEKRGISGGQRKRVNIGLELAGQPTMLFLDEPTSGLDSTSSLAVVYSLKKMCELGMNCIMVIHQPRYSLFTLFDDVLLLGKGGKTVYLGNSLGAKDYFENLGFSMPEGENRADWFMDVISGEVPNEKVANFNPKMLFQFWEERKQRIASMRDEEGAPRDGDAVGEGQHGRVLSQQEDAAVLSRVLEEEWDSIDINRDGHLDAAELKNLLSRACRLEPSEQIVKELMSRMATGTDADVVTRSEFRRFLTALSSDIAEGNGLEDSPTRQRNVAARLIDNTVEGVGAIAETVAGTVQGGMQRTVHGALNVGLLPGRKAGSKKADGEEEEEEEDSDEEDSSSSSDEDDPPPPGSDGREALNRLNRRVPGFAEQNLLLFGRAMILWWRENEERAIFYSAMIIGSLILAGQDWLCETPTWDPMASVNTHTCVGLLTSIFCLGIFGRNQPVFWRERNRGLSIPAFYLARTLLNQIDLCMMTFLFTAIYYEIRNQHIGYFYFMIPYLMVVWACSGWGYAVSTWVPPAHGPFIVSLIVFVVCGLLGNPMNLAQFLENPVLEVGVSLIAVTRWSIPMAFELKVEKFDPIYPEGDQNGMMLNYFKGALARGTWDDALGYWWSGILALFIYGAVLRVVAFLGLVFRNRDKMV